MLSNTYSSIKRLVLSLMLICIAGSVLAEEKTKVEDTKIDVSETEKIYQEGLKADRKNDMAKAMRLIRLAADKGHSNAQYDLGYLYDKAEENEFALKYYELSVEQGNAKGMYGLAGLHMTGEGVDKSVNTALHWYVKSAELKYVPALRIVAHYYEKGLGDTLPDFEKSFHYYRLAAELDDMDSIRRLMVAYEKGELGQLVDKTLAEHWKAQEARVLEEAKEALAAAMNVDIEAKK